MGQAKMFFGNIKVSETDNGKWFLGQLFPKMGQFKTFCKNIMVTNTGNICRYYNWLFGTIISKNGTN